MDNWRHRENSLHTPDHFIWLIHRWMVKILFGGIEQGCSHGWAMAPLISTQAYPNLSTRHKCLKWEGLQEVQSGAGPRTGSRNPCTGSQHHLSISHEGERLHPMTPGSGSCLPTGSYLPQPIYLSSAPTPPSIGQVRAHICQQGGSSQSWVV